MTNVAIVSDGPTHTTRVLVNGHEIEGVTSIEISPITKDSPLVSATITIEEVRLGVASPNLTSPNNQMEQAATNSLRDILIKEISDMPEADPDNEQSITLNRDHLHEVITRTLKPYEHFNGLTADEGAFH